jgi:hypothetical protein
VRLGDGVAWHSPNNATSLTLVTLV